MEEKTFKDADETVRGPEAATAADPAEAPAPVTEAAEVPAAEDTADIPAVRDDRSPEGEDTETVAPEEDEEPQDPPWCDKVFGMRRLSLYGICFGYGAGLIAAGIFDALTDIEITHASFPGLAGAVIGYFVGGYLTKRLMAKAEGNDPVSEQK